MTIRVARRVGPALVVAALLGGCGGGDDPGDLAAWCAGAEQIDDALESLSQVLLAGGEPGEVERAVSEARANVADTVGDAPGEIRDEAEAVAAVFDEIYDRYEAVDFDNTLVDQGELNDLAGEVAQPLLVIGEFNDDRC